MTREELRVFLGDHFCGCGNPPAASGALLRLLEIWDSKELAMYQELPKLVQDEGCRWLLVYLIDRHMKLTEHGGGVLASWLTDDGPAVLEALRREKADGFEKLHEMHCVHGFDVDGEHTHDCGAAERALQQASVEPKEEP